MVAVMEAELDVQKAVILQFRSPAATDLVHFVRSLPSKESEAAGVLAVSAALHAAEGERAVSMTFIGHVGRFDEVEVLAIPQIGLDDPPDTAQVGRGPGRNGLVRAGVCGGRI